MSERAARLSALCTAWLALCVSCVSVDGAEVYGDGPYALILGTAQDGGLPQIGCRGAACVRAQSEAEFRRRVSSLLVVDPESGRRWLFDATPDLPEQVALAGAHAPPVPIGVARPRLFDGIFLTHAHMGHYTGLLHLGREAYGVGTRLYTSASMSAFLSEQAPWSAVVSDGGCELVVLEPGVAVRLTDELSVESVVVPHRDEYTDTLAFVVRGPERSLLFLPDIDKWERWDRPVESLLAEVDVALLDGTFYGPGEVPGRDLAEIPHPFIVESLERFSTLSQEIRARVHFTHLNHTNPAADPDSAAAAEVRAAGMHVARELQRFEL